jgi:hypothetical protein
MSTTIVYAAIAVVGILASGYAAAFVTRQVRSQRDYAARLHWGNEPGDRVAQSQPVLRPALTHNDPSDGHSAVTGEPQAMSQLAVAVRAARRSRARAVADD